MTPPRYQSDPIPATRLDHLLTVAHLHGFAPKKLTGARVLEFGCGGGANLLSLAAIFPEVRMLGIDIDPDGITRGETLRASAGLSNLELRVGDLGSAPIEGKFDLVICHGVFSWVDEKTRHALLRRASDLLAPDGLLYLSYNTFPGWHTRHVIRDALTFFGSAPDSEALNLTRARALIAEMLRRAPDGPAKSHLLHEVRQMLSFPDWFLPHDAIAPINEPMYVQQVLSLADQYGFNYLADADLSLSALPELPRREDIAPALRTRAEFEQFLDFSAHRMFRRSIFLKKPNAPLYELPNPRFFEHCWFSTSLVVSPHSDQFELVHPNGGKITHPDRLTREALLVLISRSPGALSWQRLIERVAAEHGSALSLEGLEQLRSSLLHACCAQLVDVSLIPPRHTSLITASPCASHLARIESCLSGNVSTMTHRRVTLNEEERKVLALLDGTHDAAAIHSSTGLAPAVVSQTIERAMKAGLLVEPGWAGATA